MGATMGGRRFAGLLVIGGLMACATGGEPGVAESAFGDDPPPVTSRDPGAEGSTTVDDASSAGVGMGRPGSGTTDGAADTELGPGECRDHTDCVMPAGTCLEVQGRCEDGRCEHGPAARGVACDDGVPCTASDACDGDGACVGVDVDCGAGECVDGRCVDQGCPVGFANCNGDPADGCEVELGTLTDCAGCDDACVTGAHAVASCSAGACEFQCEAPWENCDGDWADGCEIPVGVPHQCDANGLNPDGGCWTAYCGNSGEAEATNFDGFYCMDCSTCRSPIDGQCQWCDHEAGVFYALDMCGCGAYEDLACGA